MDQKEEVKETPKQERNVEQDRLIFVEAIKNTEIAEIDTEFDEKSMEALVSELSRAKLFLLGEIHGVKENPDILYTIFKKFGFKQLALEWDKKLQAQIAKFLETGELDFETIKESRDGRITAGHFALFKKLRDEGLLGALVCFDDDALLLSPESWDARDANMAEKIVANLTDGATLVVAGDAHTGVAPINFRDGKGEHHPMGERVKEQIPEVPSGRIKILTGRIYNNKIREVGGKPEEGKISKARFYKSPEGIYLFELPKAHPAVVPNPN